MPQILSPISFWLQNWDNDKTNSRALFQRLNDPMKVKCLEYSFVHWTHSECVFCYSVNCNNKTLFFLIPLLLPHVWPSQGGFTCRHYPVIFFFKLPQCVFLFYPFLIHSLLILHLFIFYNISCCSSPPPPLIGVLLIFPLCLFLKFLLEYS